MLFDLQVFDRLADEFISALVHDFSDPVLQKQLMREISNVINRIQNPILRMVASEYVDKAVKYAAKEASPFFNNVIASDPPESVDVSANVVKDVVNKKVDSLADRIKKELEKKKNNKKDNS